MSKSNKSAWQIFNYHNISLSRKKILTIVKFLHAMCILYMVCILYINSCKNGKDVSMKIIIANVSDQPLYQQIKDQIKDAIFRNELKEGEILPSIRALANDIRVSVLTTRRVYDELQSEGFIITKVGKGSFVASQNLELLRESKRHLVEVKLTDAWKTARLLNISKSELYSMMDLLFEEEDINE